MEVLHEIPALRHIAKLGGVDKIPNETTFAGSAPWNHPREPRPHVQNGG